MEYKKGEERAEARDFLFKSIYFCWTLEVKGKFLDPFD